MLKLNLKLKLVIENFNLLKSIVSINTKILHSYDLYRNTTKKRQTFL